MHPDYVYLNAMTLRDVLMGWGNPKIALLGYGRAGKDTAGAWLGEHTPLRYVGSTSQVICPMIAKELDIPVEEAWRTRHQHRMFWYEWANAYRRDDPAKLAKKCLEQGDMVVGLRDIIELNACKAAGLFDLIIWIDRDVPHDPTVTFTKEDCDIVVCNNTDLPTFYARLARLCRFAGIEVKDD
jgi:hypothetical protein